MGAMSSQITSLAIVYSAVYSDANQRKHQSSTSLAFVRGIHRGPVNSPHKWPVTRKKFPFHDVIMKMLMHISQIAKFMGPTWVLSAPDGPHVGFMNLAMRDDMNKSINVSLVQCIYCVTLQTFSLIPHPWDQYMGVCQLFTISPKCYYYYCWVLWPFIYHWPV